MQEFDQNDIVKFRDLTSKGIDPTRAKSLILQSKGTNVSQPVQQPNTLGQELKSNAQQVFAPIGGVISGIGKVAEQTVGKAGDIIGKGVYGGLNKLFGQNQQYQTSQGVTEQVGQKLFGEQQKGLGFQAGEFIGKQLPTIGATAGIGGATSILGKIGQGALQGGTSTQLQSIAEGQGPASVGNTLLGAGIGGGLSGLGGLISKAKGSLYNSAFSQAPQEIKKNLAKYGQTAGQSVMEQNLSPSVKKGLVQIKDKLGNTRSAIEKATNKAGNIEGGVIREGLKSDLISKLGYDKLNQNAQSTKDLISKLGGIVDDMIPEGQVKPQEIVQQIKQINSNLPNTLLAKGFQDVKGNTKIQKVVENGLKNVLDKAVEKGGGGAGKIQQLYQTYGKQKTVEEILKNESIRKILGRQLVGGSVGSIGIGGLGMGGFEDIKQGNLITGLGKITIGGLAGAKGVSLAKDPNFLMKIGNVAEKVGNTIAKGGKGAGVLNSLINKSKGQK